MTPPVLTIRGGIPSFARRARAGEPLTVVAFGTSMTLFGHYLEPLSGALAAATGNAHIRLVNKGLRGFMTFAAAFRLRDDVLTERPDLVLIEFAHNDLTPEATDAIGSALDGMLAQLRAALPACEVAFVYLAPRDLAAAGATVAMRAYEETAEYYGIPSIDLATYTEALIAAGAASWTGEGAPALTHDGVHHNPLAAELLGIPFAAACVRLIGASTAARRERAIRSDFFAGASCAPATRYVSGGAWATGVPPNHDVRNADAYRGAVAQANAPGATLRVPFRGRRAEVWAMGNGRLTIALDGGPPSFTTEIANGPAWTIVPLTPRQQRSGRGGLCFRTGKRLTIMAKKRVAILGSTGSIGRQALDVIARHPERFDVAGLAAGNNVALLAEQVAQFKPGIATSAADGAAGLHAVAVDSKADIVLAATDGAVAFDAVFAAVDAGIDIAVANKELVVAAGELLFRHAKASGAKLLPVDSEHSAIFQCLEGQARDRVAGIVLTASGGPFWNRTRDEMADASVADALNHPTWNMGVKNTIDSATLMNKGLEVIEASRFFDLPGERIHVLVHRTSVAHGFALFTDGNVLGQFAPPDMRLPIGYALAYPDRLADRDASDALVALGGKADAQTTQLGFERPDLERFPCLGLAYRALAEGGVAPAALSAANEIVVAAFVAGTIRFGDMAACITDVLDAIERAPLTLDAVRAADRQARVLAAAAVGRRTRTAVS